MDFPFADALPVLDVWLLLPISLTSQCEAGCAVVPRRAQGTARDKGPSHLEN